jgi:polysaccharide deacetylase family protein (PEP-CTERM system associated)
VGRQSRGGLFGGFATLMDRNPAGRNGCAASTADHAAERFLAHAPLFLTIDVEDWFHPVLDPDGVRTDLPRRVEEATGDLLDLCDEVGLCATFFVLGDVARHHPHLAPRIAARGHEIGVHGMTHHFVASLGPERFRRELEAARHLLEDQIGGAVISYRAPYFSLLAEAEFAFDILEEQGIAIDSSIFPARVPRYGQPRAALFPHRIRPGLWEFPISVLRLGGLRLPFAGGAWFRLLPLALVAAGLDRLAAAARPAVLYLHPWELDAGQPRMPTGSWWRDRKHHYGRAAARARFTRLMRGRRSLPLARFAGPGGNAPEVRTIAQPVRRAAT